MYVILFCSDCRRILCVFDAGRHSQNWLFSRKWRKSESESDGDRDNIRKHLKKKINHLRSYISVSEGCVHKYAVTYSSLKQCKEDAHQSGFRSGYTQC